MCSIFKYNSIVGRNFDYEISYDEELKIISTMEYGNRFKIIGICAGIIKDYPLLYDGMNEYGLVCGGLAFTDNAVYNDEMENKINIPSFDFVFQILSSFKSVKEVCKFLKSVNITNKAYSKELPPADLHWFIADEEESIIVEQTKDGLKMYNGDVMTNNPIYPTQLKLSQDELTNVGVNDRYSIDYNSRGMETINLKGDYTSMGRFQRLSYLKKQIELSNNSFKEINEAFHLLSSVEQIYGVTPVNNKYEYTIYSVVYDMNNKTVHLKNYDNLDSEFASISL
ncbi:MAG: linear amide C-N hydrolase [Methanobrevibacter sp.]|uniref:linear amide C-N hydrolase n=1 Tax=Methanobrevibacter sp. TaxID=66852 RepID=UPI003F121A93